MTAHTSTLITHLSAGDSVVMDRRHGHGAGSVAAVPFEGSGWSAFAVRDHDSVVRQVHTDYIDAGAKLHIVNSFALARHVLEPLGIGALVQSLNRKSVLLCEEAIAASGQSRSAHWIAGSLSTFFAHSDRSRLPIGDVLVRNYRDQAQTLLDAGVDLFALEMLCDVEISLAMTEAVTDLGAPIILGFTCTWNSDKPRRVITRATGRPALPLGNVLEEVIEATGSLDTILSIMHSDFDVTDAALDVLDGIWEGPVAVYPELGFVRGSADAIRHGVRCRGIPLGRRQLEEKRGVQIIGGCCGLGPSHIRAFRDSH